MNGFPRPADLERPEHRALQEALVKYDGALDLLDGELAWSRRWEYPWAILEGQVAPGMAVLDAGAGHTTFGLYLAHALKAKYSAADPDARSREGFVAHARRLGVDVDYRLESLDRTTFEDGSFDRVFCISVIEHLPPEVARSAFREWRRLLKPGGLLVVTMDVNFSDTTRDVRPDRAWALIDEAEGFRVKGERPARLRPEDGIYTNRSFWGTKFWPLTVHEKRFLLWRVGYTFETLEPSELSVVGCVFERT